MPLLDDEGTLAGAFNIAIYSAALKHVSVFVRLAKREERDRLLLVSAVFLIPA